MAIIINMSSCQIVTPIHDVKSGEGQRENYSEMIEILITVELFKFRKWIRFSN